jgi:hypothetical protein
MMMMILWMVQWMRTLMWMECLVNPMFVSLDNNNHQLIDHVHKTYVMMQLMRRMLDCLFGMEKHVAHITQNIALISMW